jgi:GntR family transcriptional regulator/MocR family aminotransferase
LQPSYLLQQQLALFMRYGHLGNHLASTRAIYNQRRQVCTEYLEQKGREVLQVMPSVSGMNTYVRLHQPVEVQVLKQRLQQAGLGGEIYEVLENNTPHTYVLFGHARLTLEQMPSALEYLLQVLRH